MDPATPSDSLFEVLSELLPTGVVLLAPVREADDVTDFTFQRLNAAAERLLYLATQPTLTLRQYLLQQGVRKQWPSYLVAFNTGQCTRFAQLAYYGPLGAARLKLTAQRVGDLLLLHVCDEATAKSEQLHQALFESRNREHQAAIHRQEYAQELARLQDRERTKSVAAATSQAREQLSAQRLSESQAREQASLLLLREQERPLELFHQVLRQVPAAITTLHGPDYRFTFFNDLYQKLVGRRAVLGKPLAEALPEVVEQGFLALLDQVYESGKSYLGSEVSIWLAQPGGGPPRQGFYTFTYLPLRDAAGQTEGILVFALDVTEQVGSRRQVTTLNEELATVNQELLSGNAQLTRLNADLDSFVFTASHDLKLPLTNLAGLLVALGEELPAPVLAEPITAELLRLMRDSLLRFQDTLHHLTIFTESAAEAAGEVADVDLQQLVEDVRLDLATNLQAAQAELLVNVVECRRVRLASKLLRSVVFNLLSNAIKYHSPKRLPRILVRAHCQPGQVELTVQDNGLGLSVAQQQRLFRLFERQHAHVEGMGVGLYAIKRLIDHAGGTIKVLSTEDVGSIFTVTLPLAAEEVAS